MKNWIGTILIVMLFVAGCLQSCTTPKKVLNYMHNHADFRNKYLGENCVVESKTEYIQGQDSIVEKTVFLKGDSIQCPDVKTPAGDIIPGGMAKCPDQEVKYQERHKTFTIKTTVENTSRIKYLEQVNAELNVLLKQEEKKAKERLYYLVGIVSLATVFLLLKMYKKI